MFFSLFLISYLIASLTLSIVYYDYYAAFYLVAVNLIMMILIMKDRIFVNLYEKLEKKDPSISIGLGIFQCVYMILILPILFFKIMTSIVSYFVS